VVLPGVIGGISLILAFFAMQSLPINFAGLLLILFGIVLFIAEIKVVSHGILAVGGIVALALGSLMLFDAPEIGFRVSWRVILPTVGATAAIFLVAVGAGVRALSTRSPVGGPAMVGQIGVAQGALSPEGQVLVHGELWRAVARGGPVAEGAKVRVVDVNGLTLTVERSGEGGAA
jgi:membrane-bound serine protease (ClpP class)